MRNPALPAIIGLLLAFGSQSLIAEVPGSCRQLLVGIADTWDSKRGSIQLFERRGESWNAVSAPQPVLFGRNGLAWGIGAAGQEQAGKPKLEGDGRAPAGVFSIGKIFTESESLPPGADYPFHTVTAIDCWIEDPANPLYNTHVRIDPDSPPSWFKKEQMRQNDPAHAWKIEIRHNAAPPIPGRGSAIFFHIYRGPDRPSSGCTTMPPAAIQTIIRWLRQSENPHYVLLPAAEYRRLAGDWKLPLPGMVGLSD